MMTLPSESGGCWERSGEPMPSGGEDLCLRTSLLSQPLPHGLAGQEQRDVVGPALLPATEEEEEKTERDGLSWFLRQSWYGTVGCDRTVLSLGVVELAAAERCCCCCCCSEDLPAAVDANMVPQWNLELGNEKKISTSNDRNS